MDANPDPRSYLDKIRQALDESAIVAITDPQGTIIEVNDKFCAISKYSREELLGKNHRVINSGYHPKEFFQQMWKTILSGQKWEAEICNRAKDGSLYWVHTHIIPFRDGQGKIKEFVSIRYDVTSRKRAEENLSSLLDSHLDGLLIYDLSGRIAWHNQTLRNLFPEVGEFKDLSVEHLLGPEFEIFRTGEARITKGSGEDSSIYELSTKNYNYLSRAAYLVSLRDVTSKVRSEALLLQQERLAGIGTMASGLAHEIGTPLGVIRGRAEIIAGTKDVQPTVQAGAEIIMQQIDRVSHLVKSLLKQARGDESGVVHEIHLVSLFADINDFLQHEFKKKEISLELRVDESLEIRFVYNSLIQIFLNLFMNAIHAIEEKRRREAISLTGVINVHAVRKDAFVIVRVSDNGCGMGDEDLKKVFTPFFTTKEIGQGTGLGLATSYKLLQAGGGFFSVSSILGKGSTFEVHLPLAPL